MEALQQYYYWCGEATSFIAHPSVFTSSTKPKPKGMPPRRHMIYGELGQPGAVLCQLMDWQNLVFLELKRNVFSVRGKDKLTYTRSTHPGKWTVHQGWPMQIVLDSLPGCSNEGVLMTVLVSQMIKLRKRTMVYTEIYHSYTVLWDTIRNILPPWNLDHLTASLRSAIWLPPSRVI